MEYSNAFIAYIDILGFREIVNKNNLEFILGIYESIDKKVQTIYKEDVHHRIVPDKLPKISLVSDSIIISTDECNISNKNNTKDCQYAFKNIRFLCYLLQQIQFELAWQESIWFRGAVSYGKIHHEPTKGLFFGPDFIHTYELEKKANFPRVIVDPKPLSDLVKTYLSNNEQINIDTKLKQINDHWGYYPTDYFVFSPMFKKGNDGYTKQNSNLNDYPFWINYLYKFHNPSPNEPIDISSEDNEEKKKFEINLTNRILNSESTEVISKYCRVKDYLDIIRK